MAARKAAAKKTTARKPATRRTTAKKSAARKTTPPKAKRGETQAKGKTKRGAPVGNQNALGNEGGRPSGYDPERHPLIVAALVSAGAPDREIARLLGVAPSTLTHWKAEHIEFLNAYEASGDVLNKALEGTAIQRALGMTIETDKVSMGIIYKGIQETLPPSEGMLKFLLKNRMPEKYSDEKKVSMSADEAFLEALERMNERALMKRMENAKPVQVIEHEPAGA